MAIIGPDQLPVVLKLRDDPTKFEALATLGHPVVYIEIEDSQLEQAIRTTGDFIAQYFYLEEKLAYFNTVPLQSEYDFRTIAPDAYWIKNVNWDPTTTAISDIFGAESFLFCFPKRTKILDKDGSLQFVDDWRVHWKAKTPFGSRKLRIKHRKTEHIQRARQMQYESGNIVTAINHPIRCVNKNKWMTNEEFAIGDILQSPAGTQKIVGFRDGGMKESFSIEAPRAQCFFVSYDGDPILVH